MLMPLKKVKESELARPDDTHVYSSYTENQKQTEITHVKRLMRIH